MRARYDSFFHSPVVGGLTNVGVLAAEVKDNPFCAVCKNSY